MQCNSLLTERAEKQFFPFMMPKIICIYTTYQANSCKCDVNISRKDTCVPYCTLNTTFKHSLRELDFTRPKSMISSISGNSNTALISSRNQFVFSFNQFSSHYHLFSLGKLFEWFFIWRRLNLLLIEPWNCLWSPCFIHYWYAQRLSDEL